MTPSTLALLVALAAPADASPAADVAVLLRQFEGLPDAEAFRAHVADPVAALLTLHGAPETPAWQRLRVYDALRRFPEPRVQAFLEGRLDAVAAAASADAEAHSAVAVYLRTFPAAGAERLPALMGHSDAQLRLTAARVALESDDAGLRLAIAAWQAAHRDPLVQDALTPGGRTLR